MTLLFGLVTVPFWGYRSLSLAMLELMISDLPHIQYHPKLNISEEKVEMMQDLSNDLNKRIKEQGLQGATGLRILNKGKVTNADLQVLKK